MSRLHVKNGRLYRAMGGVQSNPRVMRGAPVVRPVIRDVQLSNRALAGLAFQGLARTVGADIEMDEECARPGEILLSPGVCGPDKRRPLDPYMTAQPKGTAAAAATAAGMKITPKLLMVGAAAVAAIYFLGRK